MSGISYASLKWGIARTGVVMGFIGIPVSVIFIVLQISFYYLHDPSIPCTGTTCMMSSFLLDAVIALIGAVLAGVVAGMEKQHLLVMTDE